MAACTGTDKSQVAGPLDVVIMLHFILQYSLLWLLEGFHFT
jgi:hypothetical protein